MSTLKFLLPQYWLMWLWLALLRIICCLPYSWQLACGRLIGRLGYWLARSHRHITEVNLKLCFPHWSEAQRQQCCKDCFISTGMGLIEMGMSWWMQPQHFAGLTHFSGIEHLTAAQKTGRGILLIGAHFTTLDLTGRLINMHYPFSVTYRQSNNPLVNSLMTKMRKKHFHQSIDRDDVRQFVRGLKNGDMIWYAPDQDYGNKVSVFAPFFGVPAATITATARLAKLTNAILMPMRQYRLDDAKGYLIEFLPPIENFPTGDDVHDATTINQIIEEGILKAPEQYLWQHRRFKTRPMGEERPY